MRRALTAFAAAGTAALALVQSGSAGPGAGIALPPNVVRAEIVLMDGGVLHDYRIDRGRLKAVGAASVTLLERDGTTVTVPVSPTAQVLVRARVVRLAALARAVGRIVETIRDRDAPASIVRVRPL